MDALAISAFITQLTIRAISDITKKYSFLYTRAVGARLMFLACSELNLVHYKYYEWVETFKSITYYDNNIMFIQLPLSLT